ncbi:hypothetical protein KCU95_g11978, partial [Aureobasidium melanogenum]
MQSFLLISSLLYVARAEKRCFDTQGSAIVDGSFVPCNSTAAVSACCATNKGQPDICIQGGLCYATQSSYSGYIYGNGCTDSTGMDSSCPYACPMAKTNGWKSYNVLPCARDRWCCRQASDQSNCCNNDTMLIDSDQTSYLGRFIDNVIPGTSTISNDSNSTDATTTSTVTATVTATSSSEPNSTNTTTVVGAAVGAVLGVACIIALAGLLWMMRKVKTLKKEMQAMQSHEPYSNSSSTTPMAQHSYNAPVSEAPTEHAYEADWNNGRYEIDGTGK